MADGLDKSLDDIIKSNRNSTGFLGRGGGNGGYSTGGRVGFVGAGSNSGPSRRFVNRVGTRMVPYSRPIQQQQAQDAVWHNDVFANDANVAAAAAAFGHHPAAAVVGDGSSSDAGTKLYISNLDYDVSNEDIKDLFSEVGELKRYGIHYDRSGRSKGTAEVVFSRQSDALAAIKRYNNVQLDGKLMKIDMVGNNLSAPTPRLLAPVQMPIARSGVLIANFDENLNGHFNGNFDGNFRWRGRGRGRGGFMGRPRGGFGNRSFRGGRGARGRGGRSSGRGRDENVSAKDLDAELDKYHKEAMETS